ncbi:MAG: glycosyltransferase family 9 protein, partial [Gammaproteobacteria bacterium]
VLMHAQVSLRANLLSLMFRSPLKLGFDQQRSRDLHGLFINRRIPPQPGQHVLDGFFSFAETLGVTQRQMRWDIPVPPPARQAALDLFPDDQPVLVISPCSSHPLRNWRAERYAQLADYAIARYRVRVVLCGGPSAMEREMGAAITGAMQQAPLNLIGKDTIKQLLAVLERASVLISPDSGPMHLATAVGTPVIGLHAASNPKRSGPYLSQQWCVDRYDAAARKFLGKPADAIKWGTKIEQSGVMDLITVDDVVERLDAFMARPMPAGA